MTDPVFYMTTSGPAQFKVYFAASQDGGGGTFGQEFVSILSREYGKKKWQRCLEWCSGPGFIGFNLLDHGVVSQISLTDIWAPSLDNARKSAACARLEVEIYQGYGIGHIPQDRIYDLIVGNPPHWSYSVSSDSARLECDPGWAVHQEFFDNVSGYLAPNGMILLQENRNGSGPDTWTDMLKRNNLRVARTFDSPGWARDGIYYIEICHS